MLSAIILTIKTLCQNVLLCFIRSPFDETIRLRAVCRRREQRSDQPQSYPGPEKPTERSSLVTTTVVLPSLPLSLLGEIGYLRTAEAGVHVSSNSEITVAARSDVERSVVADESQCGPYILLFLSLPFT